MLIYKAWKAKRVKPNSNIEEFWLRDGWFLLGFIPIYVRDRQERERF
jgi:hypothetical protein